MQCIKYSGKREQQTRSHGGIKGFDVKAVIEANYENVKTRLEWLMYDKSQVTDELIESRYNIYTRSEYKQAVYNIVCLQEVEISEKYSWDPSWCSKISVPTLLAWTIMIRLQRLKKEDRYKT